MNSRESPSGIPEQDDDRMQTREWSGSMVIRSMSLIKPEARETELKVKLKMTAFAATAEIQTVSGYRDFRTVG